MRGAGLCVRLGAGASQYGDRPAGRGRPGDILPAERPYPAGDRVSHKPLWAAEVSLLAAGQGAGFEVCGSKCDIQIKLSGNPSSSTIRLLARGIFTLGGIFKTATENRKTTRKKIEG